MSKSNKNDIGVLKVSSRNKNKNRNKSLQNRAKERKLAKENKIKKEDMVLADEVDVVEMENKVIEDIDLVKIDDISIDKDIICSDDLDDDDIDFIKIKPRKFFFVDDKKNNEVNKFEFVSLDQNEKSRKKDEELEEIYEYEEKENEEIVEHDDNCSYGVVSVNDDYIIPPTDNVDINARRYFSFESRIIILLIIIIVSFFGAGLFIYRAVTAAEGNKLTYNEKSTIDYSVCINDSSNYYKESCLDEGMEYITNISDKIEVDFDYIVDYSKDIDSKLNYYAVSKINVYSKKGGKVLHTTEEVLLERTDYSVLGKEARVSVDVNVPLGDYRNYVQNYNMQYGVDSYATLEVDFYVDNGNLIKKAATLKLPLSDTTFSIEKSEVENEKLNLNVLVDDWGNLNTSYALVGLVFVLCGLFAIIRLSNLVYKITATASLYEKKLQRILREYDRLIVIARGDYTIDDSKKLVKVASFRELLDARNTLEKPIVYVRVNNVKSEFYVEDSEAIYKYTMKEADFEGK